MMQRTLVKVGLTFLLLAAPQVLAADLRLSSGGYVSGLGSAELRLKDTAISESLAGKSVDFNLNLNACDVGKFGEPSVCTEMPPARFQATLVNGGTQKARSGGTLTKYTLRETRAYFLVVESDKNGKFQFARIVDGTGDANKVFSLILIP